jgi:hypothetical protein
MKRGYAKGQMLEYPIRFCPYCGKGIPKFSKLTGIKLRKSKYGELKTCGETVCKGMSMDTSRVPVRPKFKPDQSQPIDKFIYRAKEAQQ